MRRRSLSASLLAAAMVATVGGGARADQAPPPLAGALDFARIQVLTAMVEPGVVLALDARNASIDLRAGVVGASAEFLGFEGKALELEVAGRPNLNTTALGGALLDVGAWMIGSGYIDSSLCPWRPGTLCDPATGFIGFGAAILGFQYDTQTRRAALRLGELDLVGSPSPAFGVAWKSFRIVPRVGASLDALWNQEQVWVGRLAAGLDGVVRVGPWSVRPMVRYRPSFAGFGDDFGFESGLGLFWEGTWRGLDAAGDSLRIGVELGYAYWRIPGRSFGVDWLLTDRDSAFARLVLAPSLFTAAPPGH